jgi:hypothetical protein
LVLRFESSPGSQFYEVKLAEQSIIEIRNSIIRDY